MQELENVTNHPESMPSVRLRGSLHAFAVSLQGLLFLHRSRESMAPASCSGVAAYCSRMLMTAARSLLALLVCASLGFGGELHTLSGKIYSGELASVSEKEIGFQTGTGLIKVPVADVLRIELQREAPLGSGARYSEIELVDGTLLHAGRIALE